MIVDIPQESFLSLCMKVLETIIYYLTRTPETESVYY